MILNADKNILDFLQSLRSDSCDDLMAVITFLGDGGWVWIGWAIVLCCFQKSRKSGILMLVVLLITYLFSTIGLKNLFDRSRPCVLFPSPELFYPCPSGFSFPSGHTISSFSAAAVLFFRHEKGAVWAIVLAALIAFSRMYLYVHFPTDILAGCLLGIGSAYVLVRFNIQNKKAEH